MSGPTAYAAFLRGINVGGNKRIAMADLRALVEGLGHTDVRTLLQSGNVVFRAPGGDRACARHAAAISSAVAGELGLEVGVVVRSRDQLAAVVAHDPLREVATDPARHLVVFLSSTPDPAKVAAIDHARYAPERIAVDGSEAHLWMPAGVQKSKLPKAYEPLADVVTARNWNTVTKLLVMLDEV